MFHGNDSTLLIILQSAFFEIFETTHFGQIRYAEYNCGIQTSRLFHRLQIIQECDRQQATSNKQQATSNKQQATSNNVTPQRY
jgi:hypothetical protein